MSSSNEISFTPEAQCDWVSNKHAWRICSELCILLHLPLHSNPHSEKILSTYACESDAERCQNRQRCSLRSAPNMLGLVLTVPSAGTCQVLRYSCSPTDVWLWSRLRQNRSNCRNVRNVFAVRITLTAASYGCIFRKNEMRITLFVNIFRFLL